MLHTPAGTVHAIRKLPQLQEFELWVDWSTLIYQSLLSSIASTQLRKLVFSAGLALINLNVYDIFLGGPEKCASADENLCQLVDRLDRMGCSHTLEVEFRHSGYGDIHHSHELTKFLPRFRHKGVVTVTDGPLSIGHLYFSWTMSTYAATYYLLDKLHFDPLRRCSLLR